MGLVHQHIFNQVGDELIQHCLVSCVTPRSRDALEMAGFFHRHFLPSGQGIDNQWEKDIQLYQIYANELKALRDAGS